MKRILERPQILFLALAPAMLILGFFNKGDSITINIHDTYLVLDTWSMSLYSAVFFIMIALNYALLNLAKKPPKRKLTLLHIALQFFSLIPFCYVFFMFDFNNDYEQKEQVMLFFVLSFFIFLLATILHFVNFIASLRRKKE